MLFRSKEPKGVVPTVEKANVEKKKNMVDQRVLNKPRNQSTFRFEAKGRSLPKSQRGPRMNHVCHHCGLQGHTRPNFHKLRALNNARDQRSRGPRDDKRNWVASEPRSQNGDFGVMDVMNMRHSPHVWQTSTAGLKVTIHIPNPIGISPQTHVTCG